jgi:hypothetical protein
VSIKVITAVLRLAPAAVTPAERLVLYALGWHADEHGSNSWPAVSTIARETSLTRRTVQRTLRQLNTKGLVSMQGVAARGSLRYGVDLQSEDPDRDTVSQSTGVDCDPVSQSSPADAAPLRHSDAGGRHPVAPTATPWRGGGVTVTPDPSLIRPLTVREEEQEPRAALRAKREGSGAAIQDRQEERRTYVVAREPGRNGSAADAGAAPRASAPPAPPPVNGQDAKKAEADADTIAAYIAHDTFDTLGDDAPFPVLAEAFTKRLNGHPGAAHILDNLGPFLFGIRKRRRQHASH